jgi:hypothetical protein
MANRDTYTNKDIDYGNANSGKTDNGTTTTTTTRSPNIQYCPEGQTYLGRVNGKPKCLAATPRYRDKDKQSAYEKAIAQGIEWTGQYIKDATTGEVTPKPIEAIVGEINGVVSGDTSDNLLKKYWWVLAAAAVFILISKD